MSDSKLLPLAVFSSVGSPNLTSRYISNRAVRNFVRVEQAFTHEFGDINKSFYNSLESVLNEMVQPHLGEGSEIYPQIRERIQRLTIHADNIG